MPNQEISQRQAVRDTLAGYNVLEERNLYNRILQKYQMSLQQVKQGVKNCVSTDGTVHRSTYRGCVYYRLAETLAPKNHLDFGTSPVDVNMGPKDHADWLAERDKPVAPPWTPAQDQKSAINKITEFDLDTFANHPSLQTYQQISTKSAIYPGRGTPLGLAYVALKLNGEAGEFAEHVGKAMRDDGLSRLTTSFGQGKEGAVATFGTLTANRAELLVKEIGDVLWYLSAACNELGISLEDAAFQNLIKLHDRTVRDKLRGSGDKR